MTIEYRMQVIRLLEKMEENKSKADKIGMKEESVFNYINKKTKGEGSWERNY